mmetsp:Transcript_11395/g.18592  ORF Transcript_11395/g.18592 Transcript_11395/m.18592 type:complete len:241 (+) Transcript_11395:501-1223(+)
MLRVACKGLVLVVLVPRPKKHPVLLFRACDAHIADLGGQKKGGVAVIHRIVDVNRANKRSIHVCVVKYGASRLVGQGGGAQVHAVYKNLHHILHGARGHQGNREGHRLLRQVLFRGRQRAEGRGLVEGGRHVSAALSSQPMSIWRGTTSRRTVRMKGAWSGGRQLGCLLLLLLLPFEAVDDGDLAQVGKNVLRRPRVAGHQHQRRPEDDVPLDDSISLTQRLDGILGDIGNPLTCRLYQV